MNEDQLLNELEARFGAIPEDPIQDGEELRFLDDRNKFEDIYSWNFDAFVKHYQLIKEYALEEKLLEILAWRIKNIMDEEAIEELKCSEFFKTFGNHSLIQNSIVERGF